MSSVLTITDTLINGQIKRTLKGPKNVIARQFWPKFGDTNVLPKQAVPDVYMEFNIAEKEESIPNGYYITKASEEGWSKTDIDEIRFSSLPDQAYAKIVLRKAKAIIAQVDSKYQPKIDALFLNQSDENVVSGETPNGEPPATKVGLRARFVSKKSTITKETTTDKGLSARMRDIKEKTRQNQQEATLFVSNVPLDYTERDIREVLDNIRPDFEAVRINIVKKYSEEESVKSSTGSAFIVLKNKEDAQECINFLHGYRWDNLIACADFASSKE